MLFRSVANNLESFKRKREELGQQLQAALEKLPESSDLPALLTNISTLGKKSGLEIQTFKQGKKIDRGFYSEQQIELQFTGFYHDIALFFDRVANLSRIVNLNDLVFEVESDAGENPTLKVKGTAATFYFNDSSKTSAPAEKGAPQAAMPAEPEEVGVHPDRGQSQDVLEDRQEPALHPVAGRHRRLRAARRLLRRHRQSGPVQAPAGIGGQLVQHPEDRREPVRGQRGPGPAAHVGGEGRSEEHTSELQSPI